jgi:tetratricopeptide (TPR) repeat protein
LGYIEENKKFIDSPLMEFYDLEADFLEQNNLAQKMDLASHKKKMDELVDNLTSSRNTQNRRRSDRDTLEKLKSLGYVSSQAQIRAEYGPEDDLKTLLPFHQKKTTAILLFANNRITEAVKLLQDIIHKRKDFTDAYSNLARIYESQGSHEEALATMETAYQNNPENYGVILNYGILLVKTGHLEEGIAFLRKAIGIIETDPDAWIQLGLAYSIKREFQKALEFYEKALTLDNTNAWIHDNLGFLHFSIYQKTGKVEDNDAALENFQKAIELDPHLASAYNGLGGAYKAAGQLERAIAAWEKSLELAPDYSFPLYNLGVAYLQKGDKNQALKYFERYLFLNYRNLSPEEIRKIEGLILMCKSTGNATGRKIYN